MSKEVIIWLGIDPGRGGGLAALHPVEELRATKMPATEYDLWDWLSDYGRHGDISNPPSSRTGADETVSVLATIEEIDPRPTYFNGTRSILRSTCIIYGEYRMCRASLAALGIPFLAVRPKDWQGHYGLVRGKKEGDTPWKNRLKTKAQTLFPSMRVTLATADALLLAEYGRQKMEAHHAPESYRLLYSPGRDPIL